ncbi:MAG TPA: preprotein translocase subunit SecG [Candidatus Saccharimonadales bacterium]|nr:preprotein translocase subunit SecG [Candidatus Saccharimonadales bacterium]
MKNLFNTLTIISAVVIVTTVLLQHRGSSLGAGFGGDTNFYRSQRGAEKVIFNATIVAGVVFVVSIILGILSKR